MTQPIHFAAEEHAVGNTRDHAADDAPEAPLLEHSYDGIREYDNPLPGWWRSMFLGTIVFAGFYVLYFHALGWGRSPDDAYQRSLTRYKMTASTRAPGGATASEDLLTKGAFDSDVVGKGESVFVAKCAGCHGADGHGLIGPNLTDDFQIHGTTRVDMFETIRDGVATTPMPAWGSQLSGDELIAVATFATTLRGKNVPGGKAPQGTKVAPFKH